MDQEQINLLQALRDALKQREDLCVSMLDSNIFINQHHARFHREIVAQRKLLEVAIESLRHSPFSVTDTGIEIIRTLVLINNAIRHLTGEEEPVTRVIEIEKKRN